MRNSSKIRTDAINDGPGRHQRLFFAWFWETRAFYHVLRVLIVPCTLALTHGYGAALLPSRVAAANADNDDAAVELA